VDNLEKGDPMKKVRKEPKEGASRNRQKVESPSAPEAEGSKEKTYPQKSFGEGDLRGCRDEKKSFDASQKGRG